MPENALSETFLILEQARRVHLEYKSRHIKFMRDRADMIITKAVRGGGGGGGALCNLSFLIVFADNDDATVHYK